MPSPVPAGDRSHFAFRHCSGKPNGRKRVAQGVSLGTDHEDGKAPERGGRPSWPTAFLRPVPGLLRLHLTHGFAVGCFLPPSGLGRHSDVCSILFVPLLEILHLGHAEVAAQLGQRIQVDVTGDVHHRHLFRIGRDDGHAGRFAAGDVQPDLGVSAFLGVGHADDLRPLRPACWDYRIALA